MSNLIANPHSHLFRSLTSGFVPQGHSWQSFLKINLSSGNISLVIPLDVVDKFCIVHQGSGQIVITH